jgi:hypothetical protein
MISRFKEKIMLHEHAITYKDKITLRDLDYLVKKANKLGRSGKEIVHINEESDLEGTHVYYFIRGIICEQRRNEIEVREEC